MSGRLPDHRIRAPVMFQDWEHLTLLHWPYDAATVQQLVPEQLTVQEWDGVTWVGITPFRMARVRPAALPPPPGWGAFPELNVRAYVRTPDGRDGIWFLGMVVPRLTFIAAARGGLGLPYERSRSFLSTDASLPADVSLPTGASHWSYRFDAPHRFRARPQHWFRADVQVGRPLEETDRTPLLESLTGRWTAFHRRARMLWRTPIEHEPWPLHAATATGDLTAPLRWAGLPTPAQEPLVQAAPYVRTRFGAPRPA